MEYSLLGYYVHGISQVVLLWVASLFFRGSSWPWKFPSWSGRHSQLHVLCLPKTDSWQMGRFLPISLAGRFLPVSHWRSPYYNYILLWFSHSSVSDSLWPHWLQHARFLCPSLSPGVCSNSCPLSHWCHPTISSSVSPFSSCPRFSPESGSFLMSWLFTSGGQSIGASVSVPVLPMNTQGWFPLRLTDLIPLQSKGLRRVFSNTTVQKHQFLNAQPFLSSNSHIRTWQVAKP